MLLKYPKNNNTIILCLDKTESVKEVIFVEDRIVNNAREDTVVLDLSTTLANETVNFANQLNKKNRGCMDSCASLRWPR